MGVPDHGLRVGRPANIQCLDVRCKHLCSRGHNLCSSGQVEEGLSTQLRVRLRPHPPSQVVRHRELYSRSRNRTSQTTSQRRRNTRYWRRGLCCRLLCCLRRAAKCPRAPRRGANGAQRGDRRIYGTNRRSRRSFPGSHRTSRFMGC